jgi:hypothetical protein
MSIPRSRNDILIYVSCDAGVAEYTKLFVSVTNIVYKSSYISHEFGSLRGLRITLLDTLPCSTSLFFSYLEFAIGSYYGFLQLAVHIEALPLLVTAGGDKSA